MKRKKKANTVVKKIAKNTGFSLLEVLLAIVILGLVAAPILQIFVTSAQMNLRARKIMAATDVANTTMEYLTSLKFEGDTGSITKIFTDTVDGERIPGLGYTAEAENISTYESMTDFKTAILGSYTGTNASKLYTNNVSGKCLGVAVNNVEYNNYIFDMIIWFDSNKTGTAQYYTYDVTIEVYEAQKVTTSEDADGDGNPDTSTTHFAEQLISVEGAVANK